jgi:hypothetical protein
LLRAVRASSASGLRVEDDGGNLGIFIEDGGQVGINQATPGYPLHIGAGTDTLVRTEATLAVQVDGAATIVARDNTGDAEVFLIASGSGFVGTATNDAFNIYTNNAHVATFAADGKFGIANSGPSYLVHIGAGTDTLVRTETSLAVQIAGTATATVRDNTNNVELAMIASTSGFVGTATANSLHLITNNSTKLTILSTGEVGINESSPDGKLDVGQTDNAAAIPTLELEQADLSEEFINFVGTIGAGNSIEADTTPPAAPSHKIRVATNGTFRYIYVYDS